MLNYYRFRSESLHEGHGGNISTAELHSLEEYTRNVLKKCLCRCKNSITTNTTVTWNEIKSELINDLKNAVTAAKTAGILPALIRSLCLSPVARVDFRRTATVVVLHIDRRYDYERETDTRNPATDATLSQ